MSPTGLMLVAAFACLLAGAGESAAQTRPPVVRDTGITHVLYLVDGSTLVGKLIDRDSVAVRFETNGGLLVVPIARVKELRAVAPAELRGNEYWFPDANETRLFFAPTGRMLKKGEGYYSNTYLVLQNFVGGMSDRFTFGGGFSILPTDDFLQDNIYYLTPKLGLYNTPKTNVAVGILAGVFPGMDFNNGNNGPETFGILYAVGTRGGPEASVTGGLGYGFDGGDFHDQPVFMIGGAVRTARRVSLVTENYGSWTQEPEVTGCGPNGCVGIRERIRLNAVLSYGIRFMGEKLSTDFALWNVSENFIFPGLPYIAFAVKF